jgi:uncharacterized protein (DUF1778 family)
MKEEGSMERDAASRKGRGGARPARERVDFRLEPEHKALIERAAAYRGETMTGYAISTLVREAQRVVREHEVVTLSERDRDRFLELLENPPEPTDALRRAATRHQTLIAGSE